MRDIIMTNETLKPYYDKRCKVWVSGAWSPILGSYTTTKISYTFRLLWEFRARGLRANVQADPHPDVENAAPDSTTQPGQGWPLLLLTRELHLKSIITTKEWISALSLRSKESILIAGGNTVRYNADADNPSDEKGAAY